MVVLVPEQPCPRRTRTHNDRTKRHRSPSHRRRMSARTWITHDVIIGRPLPEYILLSPRTGACCRMKRWLSATLGYRMRQDRRRGDGNYPPRRRIDLRHAVEGADSTCVRAHRRPGQLRMSTATPRAMLYNESRLKALGDEMMTDLDKEPSTSSTTTRPPRTLGAAVAVRSACHGPRASLSAWRRIPQHNCGSRDAVSGPLNPAPGDAAACGRTPSHL